VRHQRMAILLLPIQALLSMSMPEARIQQLSGMLLGAGMLQDEQAWAMLQTHPKAKFSEIAGSTYTASSSRHGLGVYASEDLEAGTVASFYPVHSIGLGGQRLSSEGHADYWEGASAVGASGAYRSTVLHDAMAPGTFVDVDLRAADVNGWLAHRTNDAATCSGDSESEILDYLETCARDVNCAMVPFGKAAPIMALCTTRAVQKDEELLICYGHSHWIEQVGGTVSPEAQTSAVARAGVAIWGGGGTAASDGKHKANFMRLMTDRYESEVQIFEGLLARTNGAGI